MNNRNVQSKPNDSKGKALRNDLKIKEEYKEEVEVEEHKRGFI